MDRTDVRNYLKAELQQRRIAEAKDRPVNFSLRPPPDFASQFNRLSDMQKSTMARLLGTTINDCRALYEQPSMRLNDEGDASIDVAERRFHVVCDTLLQEIVEAARVLEGDDGMERINGEEHPGHDPQSDIRARVAEKYEQARLDEMREQHEAHGLPLPDVEGVAEEPASTEQPQAAPAPRSVAAQPTQPTPAPQHVQQQPQLQAAREVALFTHPSSLVNYPI